MATHGGPNIVEDGLVFYIDPANTDSYVSGSETTFSLFPSASITLTGSLVNDVSGSMGDKKTWNFDRVSDYINLGNSTFTGTTYSLSLWFKSSETATMILSEKVPDVGGDFAYRIYLYGGTGNLELRGSQTSGTVYNDGNFHNIVIVQDPSLASGNSKGYVDGELVTQNNFSSNTTGANDFYIGCRNGSSYFFGGDMGPIKIYNLALSAQEIKQNFNALNRFGI
jgi:hypothetical protein